MDKLTSALRIARMYYYQNMTTEAIARECGLSRSTVSRLLSYARAEGLVDVRIVDPKEHPQLLEQKIAQEYGVERVHVVPVSEMVGEAERLERVAQYAASYLNNVFNSNQVLGIAWGTTTSAISRHLLPKATHQAQIVQLNGAGNLQTLGIEYASQIIMRFAENYQATPHLFPVPAFFDRAATKRLLWQESSLKRLLDLQQQADLLLYSIGAVNAGIPSHVYSGGYLSDSDRRQLAANHIAGDIATVFFREDGSYQGVDINQRSSGPDLELFQHKHGICVISGPEKLAGLRAALRGHLLCELIIDEPAARQLIGQNQRA